jgi:hypothetical protein
MKGRICTIVAMGTLLSAVWPSGSFAEHNTKSVPSVSIAYKRAESVASERLSWMADGYVLRAFDSFGKAWKLRVCCELMLDAQYSWNACEQLGRRRPTANEGVPQAAEAVRRLFPEFKVTWDKTNAPVIFIEDTRIKKPVLQRHVKLRAYDGRLFELVNFLRTQDVYLSWPWCVTHPPQWPMGPEGKLPNEDRVVHVPAMESTLGNYLATALVDKRFNDGMCFCLISSPTGVRNVERAFIVGPKYDKLETRTVLIESVLYVQSLDDTNRPPDRGNLK